MQGSGAAKPKLNRTSLQKEGIFYLEEIAFSSSDHAIFKNLCETSKEVVTSMRTYLGPSCPGWNYANSSWQIPAHVDWLREVLLDCTGLLPKSATDVLMLPSEREAIPKHAIFHDEGHMLLSATEREKELEFFRDIFKVCREIATVAKLNHQRGVKECDWQFFMEHYIFKRYRGGARSIFDRQVLGSDV